MSAQPIIEFRDSTTGATILSSIQLIGAGFSNSIVVGSTSSVATCRIYNNYSATGGIGNAINCTLAVFDDTTHQGSALTAPVSQQWVQVEVVNYNGSTTNADTAYVAIGGIQTHAVPTNSGTISATGASYITVNIQCVVPANAEAAISSIGIYLEYSWV